VGAGVPGRRRRVFERTGTIEDVPDGYRAMNDRDVLKFQIAF